MKPVFYHNSHTAAPIKTSAELHTIGSLITILDFVLVNGGNQLNVLSGTRTGTVLTIKTTVAHTYVEGDVLHLENTEEPLYNTRLHVKSVPNIDEVTFDVLNVGASTIGAVGTIKNAAAGWTKVFSQTNGAVYRTGLLPDGSHRFVQVRHNGTNGTYEVGFRIAKNQSGFNTADVISAERFYNCFSSFGNWMVIADDKGFYILFENTRCFYTGYMDPIIVGDVIPFFLTTGTIGSSYSSSFGAYSMAPLSGTSLNQTTGSFLESSSGYGSDINATITKLGSIARNGDNLSTSQDICRPVNPLSGDYLVTTVDAWEKVSDSGQTHVIRAKVRGLYQPYGKVPSSLFGTKGFFKIKSKNLLGKDRDLVITSVDGTSGAQLAFDITGDW